MPWTGTYGMEPRALFEADKGFREGADFQNGLFAQVPYYVLWEDRFTLANEILGVSEYLGGTTWNRVVPRAYPPSPNMYAESVQIIPEGAPLYHPTDEEYSEPQYTHAVVLVTYRTPTTTFSSFGGMGENLAQTAQEQSLLLWSEQEIDHSVETYAIPRERFIWADAETESRVEVRLTIPVQTMTITYHRLPLIPFRIVGGYIGKLNDRTFFGCEPGTIMCLGARTNRQWDTSGYGRQRAQLQFKYRPRNWNHEFNPETGAWDELEEKATGKSRYSYANHLQLLNFVEFNAAAIAAGYTTEGILWGVA
jgi:hypothetical protein